MKNILLIAALLMAASAFARDRYYDQGYYIPPVYVAPQRHNNSYDTPRMDSGVDAIGRATRREIERMNNYEDAMLYQRIMGDRPRREH